MTPERWQAVKRLFNDALEREPRERAAYVAEAAKTDPALAEEVRALLSGQGRADEAFNPLTRTGALKTLTEGTRLGPYEIVSLIAAGGMGEVYKARDTRLDRTVAVKVLPADVAADAGLRTRFEREARTISSLSHPHICGLYDVGEQDGRSFLVMEYLEGDSLTDRLTKGPLPLDQALRHATEIAEALAEAHRHGVVHRDLKPGNVMLTEKGAKLLDFGIAKLRAGAVSEDAPAATATALTGEGLIVGTPQYMAPEQLEGKQVDARTDVFAFGVVLYEMVTGRKAFEAPSRAGLIAAILEREPPPLSQFQALSPPSLDALVKRCIAKRPADRFQSAQDLAFSLELVSTPSGIAAAGPAARLAGSPSRRRSTLAVLGVGLGALAAGALAGRILWRAEPAASAPVHVSRLTEFAGLEEFPALSPDGKSVAFTADVDGKRQLWVRLLAGGPALQLTREPTDHLHPRWSRDGSSLVYFSPAPEHEEAGSLWEVSALGGAPRRLARSLSGADRSRADDRLAFFRLGTGRTELVVAERDGSDLRVMAELEPGYVYGTPRWSPDGRFLAYERHYTTAGEIFVIGTGETRPRQLIGGIDFVNGLGWLPDGSGLAFSSSQGSTLLYLPTFQLWTLRLGDGRPRQLTFGEASYVHPDFDRSGALVASRVQMRSDLWRFPADGDGVENVRRAAQVMRQTAQVRTPSVSPDGREVVYVSDVPGHSNLWVTRLEDGQARQLTFERDRSLRVGVPVWSPDGRQIAFYWQGDRTFGYSIIQPDGSGLRRILTGGWWACWSPDGRWLYYQDQTGAPARPLKKVPIEGGPPMLVRSENANKPALSPDGKTLYFVVEVPRATGAVDYEIRSASPEEGPSRLLARIAAHRMPGALHSHPVLSPDGRWLAMPLIDGLATNVWAIATADGAMRPLTGFGNRPTLIARRVSWSPDGRFVYAAVSEGESDIVLLDGLVRREGGLR